MTDGRRIAIIGFVEDSTDEAPLSDPSIEQWGFNASIRLLDPQYNFARWYELHAVPKLDEDIPNLSKARIPVYMQKTHPEVPTSVAFPLEEAKALALDPYFTNSVSFMIAHAILEGVSEIGLYGVDMAIFDGDGPSELEEQRPSVEYFIGLARGRGIKVIVPDTCDLLKATVLYGYEDHVEAMGKRLRARLLFLRRYRERAQRDLDYFDGAIGELLNNRRRYFTDEPE